MRSPEEERELREFFKKVRKVLIKKGLLKEEALSKRKEEVKEKGTPTFLILKKTKEKRHSLRLNLSRDFNRTIILRIRPLSGPEYIKSFTNNISSSGLCFDSQREFEKDNKLSLRLFFYGDRIPMMKIQAHVVWKKKIETTNYYGVYFDLIDEKDKAILTRYIESTIERNPSYPENPLARIIP